MKKIKKKQKSKLSLPKTVQQTIPYVQAYKNGIIETKPGIYTKSYTLEDVNFKIATQDEQENIFEKYQEFLNSFKEDVKFQIVINNKNIDPKAVIENIMIKSRGDGLDIYRQEYNDILKQKMSEGRNNLVHEKKLIVSINASNMEEADRKFTSLDMEIAAGIKEINGFDTMPDTLEQRMECLHDIYNIGHEGEFIRQIKNGNEKELDLKDLKKMGITTKDIIGPPSFNFRPKGKNDYFMVGEKYARTLYLQSLPNFLSADFLTDLADIPCNMLTSVHFEPVDQVRGLKMVKNQNTNIRANVIKAQKKASSDGYDPSLISPELQRAEQEAKELLSDMTSRNQKLFLVTTLITHFANSLEELNNTTENIVTTGNRYLCQIKKLLYQQEQGFTSTLPLCLNQVCVDRLLTTENAGLFIPFAVQEISQENGMYYGLNAISKNMIMYNRVNSLNGNGVILGTPGSGKSMTAKQEIINVLLNTNDDVYIIDPEREYVPIADLFGGEVIRISPGSKVHINPLDMDLNYGDEDGPISLKSDFICNLCETILGGHYGLTPIQKSIIDRCVNIIYKPYIEYLQSLGTEKTFDRNACPTLNDFYDLLLSQPEPESQEIAVALELYTCGSLDAFAHKTNVDTSRRFIVYDIKDLGTTMKEMGLQICLDTIWNKMIANHKEGKRTWFYIDEFYLLTQTESSAVFLQQIWKRARKWMGLPCGITQNVEDLLKTDATRAIIQCSDFVLMLKQAPLDGRALASMLNISDSQMSFVTNSGPGQGLIYNGHSIIPFINKFPQDTKLFKAMTTKGKTKEEREKEEKKAS